MRKAIIFVLAFLLLLPLVKADTYLTGCAVLDTPGETYYLTQDIINSTVDTCMNITADNVILDCQGHTIDGNGTSETYGIYAEAISNITIKNCKLTEWWMGILLIDSHDNMIYSNVIQDNSFYGIYLFYPGSVLSPNKIYNNLFNNSMNYGMGFSFYISPNFWNTTRQAGARIYSAGTEIGGNYWTNPNGTGYSDTCTDADKDGFCDDPYVLSVVSNSTDYLPLSNQYLPSTTTTTTLPPVHGVPLLSSTLVGTVIGVGIITFMLRTLFDITMKGDPKKIIEYFIVLAVIVLTVISIIVLFT